MGAEPAQLKAARRRKSDCKDKAWSIWIKRFVRFLADRTNGRDYATVLRRGRLYNVMYCG